MYDFSNPYVFRKSYIYFRRYFHYSREDISMSNKSCTITLPDETKARVVKLAQEMKQSFRTTLEILIGDGLKYVDIEHPKVKQ